MKSSKSNSSNPTSIAGINEPIMDYRQYKDIDTACVIRLHKSGLIAINKIDNGDLQSYKTLAMNFKLPSHLIEAPDFDVTMFPIFWNQ